MVAKIKRHPVFGDIGLISKTNRPIGRYLIKLYFDLLGGRRRSHEQDWWPGVRLTLPEEGRPGEIIYKDRRVAPLAPLDILEGPREEITIIGSGPSISGQDFSRLPDHSAILLNGAIHLLDKRLQNPLAVMVEDERFVWRHFGNMVKLIKPQTPCLFSTSTLRAICEIDASWLASQQVIHMDFLQKPYAQARPSNAELASMPFLSWSADRSNAISLMPQRGVFAGGSVAVTAVQIALHLKPATLGLAGIDLLNAGEPRFYETSEDSAKSRILRAQDKILDIYAVVLKECERLGIKLVNYSPVSSLSRIGVPYDDRLSRQSSDPKSS